MLVLNLSKRETRIVIFSGAVLKPPYNQVFLFYEVCI